MSWARKISGEMGRSCLILLVLMGMTGLIYPLFITGVGHFIFPAESAGSLVYDAHHTVVGSRLIGQNFTAPGYFWGRPSATTPSYNALASSGSNLGPTNPNLVRAIQKRIDMLTAADAHLTGPFPISWVTSSGSGLDPDITVAAAELQAKRVANVRHLPLATVEALIAANTTPRQFGFLGEVRVNVLMLNRALDSLSA